MTEVPVVGHSGYEAPSPPVGEIRTIHCPATGDEVSRYVVGTADDVRHAVAAARSAGPMWARTSAAERAAALRRAAEAVRADAEALARLTTAEMGRPYALAREGVDAAAGALDQCAELGPLHGGRTLQGSWDAADLLVRQPRGVVAAITPWNDPVALPAGLLGAALATGNTVVFKPSERVPATSDRLAGALRAALPPGVLTLVQGDAETGRALARSEVDVLAHVGSTRAGRSIATTAAARGVKVLLENGGNDALIVDADVDAQAAATQVAVGACINTGQLCTSVERVFVHAALAEEFLVALVKEMESFVMGPGMEPGTTLGPLVDRRARDTVHAQVAEAIAAGAVVLTGGWVPDGPGAFYPPTVLTGVAPDMAVMTEETFGPVVPVTVVDDFAEALAAANNSRYGLAATVFTSSMEHAHQAWRELEVGTVKVNAVFGGAPGGFAHPRRDSGEGFGYGPGLFDELTTVKVVHVGRPIRESGR